jgi:glycine betaine catabolism B
MSPVREAEAVITEIIQRTYNVKSFRVDAGRDPAYRAGQFMAVYAGSREKPRRWLSLSSSPTEKGYLEFTKKMTGSDFCRELEKLEVGGQVHVQFPYGAFVLREQDTKVAFLSGGIGITPVRSICKYIVDTNLGIDVRVLLGNRSVRDIVFRDDFESMPRCYPRLRVGHVLAEPCEELACELGVIDARIIRREIPDFIERRFFLCGPPGMVEALKKTLTLELGVDASYIVTEQFVGY